MFKSKFKKLFFVFCCFFFFVFSAFSQTEELMFDSESPFLLQDVPIYEGIDEFQAKLDKIRSEENREPLGLVLCGGSARAYAHVGVLRAMEENGVVPDFIIANSMGAIIGMLYAYGFSPDKIAQMIGDIELTQFFEPVMPFQGGFLSCRKYQSFIDELVGKHYPDGSVEPGSDIKDSVIPIVVLTEDLYTKRQIWHAQGDFSTIMIASFAMPVYMEPVKMTLSNEQKVDLVDSGTLDIGALKVATHFSPNLIVSTAFYDTKLNYNSVLTVLNRTMSIGKERITINDLKKFKPVIVRNEVENYSFMMFDKAKEFFQIGYECASKVMDKIVASPHGNLTEEQAEWRKTTDFNADETFKKVNSDSTFPKKKNYAGVKVWPIFPATEYPDYNLYNKNSLSVFGFADTKHLFAKLGMNFPFNFKEFTTEAYFQYDPISQLSFKLLSYYSFLYAGGKPNEFYGSSTIAFRPKVFPACIRPLFLTAEFLAEPDFSALKSTFFSGGIEFKSSVETDYYVSFKPIYFVGGKDFDSLSHGAGGSFESILNFNIFGRTGESYKTPRFSAGITENASFRYAVSAIPSHSSLGSENAAETQFFHTDYYRSKIDIPNNQYLLSNASELYFVCLDPRLSFFEVFIVKQWKIGGFYDFVLADKFYSCTGGFWRANVSLAGLSDLIFDIGGGYDFSAQKGIFVLGIKSHM